MLKFGLSDTGVRADRGHRSDAAVRVDDPVPRRLWGVRSRGDQRSRRCRWFDDDVEQRSRPVGSLGPFGVAADGHPASAHGYRVRIRRRFVLLARSLVLLSGQVDLAAPTRPQRRLTCDLWLSVSLSSRTISSFSTRDNDGASQTE